MNKAELLKIAKPILFSTPMVKALLNGTKTETRRPVKFAIRNQAGAFLDSKYNEVKPPYQKGDILYVRETWCQFPSNAPDGMGENLYYRADQKDLDTSKTVMSRNGVHWRPSVHMPKEAARIFLEVTEVKVERVHDITNDGAAKEGISCFCMDEPRILFSDLWESVYAKRGYGWNKNPYVWVMLWLLLIKY